MTEDSEADVSTTETDVAEEPVEPNATEADAEFEQAQPPPRTRLPTHRNPSLKRQRQKSRQPRRPNLRVAGWHASSAVAAERARLRNFFGHFRLSGNVAAIFVGHSN